jgi:hypothetical protein
MTLGKEADPVHAFNDIFRKKEVGVGFWNHQFLDVVHIASIPSNRSDRFDGLLRLKKELFLTLP